MELIQQERDEFEQQLAAIRDKLKQGNMTPRLQVLKTNISL